MLGYAACSIPVLIALFYVGVRYVRHEKRRSFGEGARPRGLRCPAVNKRLASSYERRLGEPSAEVGERPASGPGPKKSL